jgi:hypothetical protein
MSRALVACLLALAFGATATPAGRAGTLPPADDPAALTLRLPDLGPGYVVSDEEDADALCVPYQLTGLPGRPVHRGCDIDFTRAWRAPRAPAGPAIVESDAYVFDDAAALVTAFAQPRALAAAVFGAPRRLFRTIALAPSPPIGDATAVLRGDTGVAIALWRSGSVLGVVLVGDRGAQGSPTAALRLAAAQQARIAAPAPRAPADLDDLEVPLDDPRIAGPIYWLGRELPASSPFPRLPLADVEQPSGGDARGGLRASLHYGRDIGYGTSISVMTSDPDLLHKPGPRRELRQIRRAHCTVLDRVALPSGHATIFTGSARCPHYGDTFALVRLPGALVTVTPEGCQVCNGPVSRYRTRAGLKTLVRALRLRQPPAP